MEQKRQRQEEGKSSQKQNQAKKKKALEEQSFVPKKAAINIVRIIPKDKPEEVTVAKPPENQDQEPVTTSSVPDNFHEIQPEAQPPKNLSRGLTKQDFLQRNEIRLWKRSSLPDFCQGLAQTELAKRWRLNSSTIGQYRSKSEFPTWSQQRDPEGIMWEYRPAGHKNIPQFFPITGEEKTEILGKN